MADVTAAMVKELRERTQAPMGDCKKALVEAGGEMNKAVEILQKIGAAKTAKAAGKVAADGAILSAVTADGSKGWLLELNCQTDFVARGDDFKAVAKAALDAAVSSDAADLATLEAVAANGSTVKGLIDAATAKSGEKHALRRMERFATSGGVVTTYIHHGARLGVLLELASAKGNSAEVRAFADELALQIASMGPRYATKADVPADAINKQREILGAQMDNEEGEAKAAFDSGAAELASLTANGELAAMEPEAAAKVKEHVSNLEKEWKKSASRPAESKAKILDGKVNKWLTEIVLVEQLSIKESKKTVATLIADFAKTHGATSVTRFARYEVGEGVDKGEKDFAAEVAATVAAAQKG